MYDRTFVYHEECPKGIPPDFPNKENVLVLKDVFQHRPGPYRRLLQCGEWLYTLLLEYNTEMEDCVENMLLNKLYDAHEKDERGLMYAALNDCGTPFWSFVLKDYRQRYVPTEQSEPFVLDPFSERASTSIKLQVKTVNNSLDVFEHERELAFGPELFPNPLEKAKTFTREEVKIMERVSSDVYRVLVNQDEYCLRTAWWRHSEMLEDEVKKLDKLMGHRNILQLKGLMVNDKNEVMGILTPFIHGKALTEGIECGVEQKEKWKSQFLDAIDFVHKNGVAWGDAKPHNILVDSEGDLCLIDFEGGGTDGWVPRDLHDTIDGDKVAIPKILSFIDSLECVRK